MTNKRIWAGCDVGSSRTKVAALDESKTLVGYAVHKSGTDFTATAQRCLDEALSMASCDQRDIVNATSTGYGRKNVSYASDSKTEIGCHAAGCYHYFPKPITIIDIGGQDNKVIKLNEQGQRLSFKMNRK
jgi:activator of 2-hydroxyglutaryl-CoA dehydratase